MILGLGASRGWIQPEAFTDRTSTTVAFPNEPTDSLFQSVAQARFRAR